MISYRLNEKLEFAEYREFLTRTDLGSQYPAERFEDRVRMLLARRSLAITARDEAGKLVGVAFGLTDFAYFLFVTDLGVDRDFVKQGIGRKLLETLRAAAGGAEDITAVAIANRDATGFYEKCGYETSSSLRWKPCEVWTPHSVE